MQAIATLVDDDPYLSLPRAERIAARKLRMAKFRLVTFVEPIPETIPEPTPAPVAVFNVAGRDAPISQSEVAAIHTSIKASRPTLVATIQEITAQFYAITRAQLLHHSRVRKTLRPRQIAIYLSRELTPMSFMELGRRFGGRDHTTIMYSIGKIEDLLLSDPKLAVDLNAIRSRIAEARGSA